MLRYNLSYWERETFFKGFDVAVIGSGLVGLTAAMHLKMRDPKLRIAIFERGVLPAGASTRNAGFACFGSMAELLDDMTHLGEDDVLAVVEKRWRGLQALRALVGDATIDFQMLGGYELFTDDEEDVFRECVLRMPDFNEKVGAITGQPDVYSVVDEQLPQFGFRGVQHLILNRCEGQVHTGKMVAALLDRATALGIKIFNGIALRKLEDTSQGVELETETGWTIRVPRVLVAVNGFAKTLLPDIEVSPARNQVLITQPVENLAVEGCFHYDRGYFYFRNIDNRILLGGGRHLDHAGEQTGEFGPNELVRSALVQMLKTLICPGVPVEVDTWWTGILGLGPVKKPIVERYSKNVVVAVRLSGMGLAIGTLIGQEGAEMLLEG
ncbi:MAG: FAD-binding oxidoreductase [Lewinellaceae bacterium]|nr:FAD-binding oxidoreductase [Saprospiraceae bacterium]MCB9333568.1 FAD-binding oxidoreductase [Lewinellaceae bacterium]